MNFYIKTFGCQMNDHDSNLIAALLKNAGHQPCGSAEEADIIVVNTCCVRQSAEDRALGFIGSAKGLKANNPRLILVVCGCMSQQKETAAVLRDKYRHIGIIIGTFAMPFLPQYIETYAATGQTIIDIEERYEDSGIDSLCGEPLADASYKSQVNINFGCNNFCSYCIVPYVRGRERSRRPEEILAEIADQAKCGVREVQLLGQNVNSYGKDFSAGEWNFARLLSAVSAIDGIERIRYMTSHPRDFDRQLAEAISVLPKVCRHFHLPVQSGSDRLLSLMNRGYTTDEYLRKLALIRELTPDAAITTDLIVGFPGESEDDFQQTLDFLREARFDAAYTFIYSRRSGTKAAEMPGHLDLDTKKQRLQLLMATQNPISLAQNKKLVGSLQEVVVEGESKNRPEMSCGRNGGNKIVVFPSRPGLKPGNLATIKITGAKTWNLSGIVR